jgi:hypothetical protein
MLRRFCMMRRLIQLRLAVFAAMGFAAAAVRSATMRCCCVGRATGCASPRCCRVGGDMGCATSRRCRVGGSMVCTTTRCYGMGTTGGGSSV